MQAVSTDQSEEAGQERTAIRAIAFNDQVMEFVDFHRNEAQTEQEGQEQPGVNAANLAFVHADHRHTVGDGAEQQQEGFNQDKLQIEDVFARGTASGPVHQYCISREQARKQNTVAHQVDPESEDFGLSCVVVPMLCMGCVMVSQSIS
ncbi:hypothetical protein D3C71_1218110 [compost metagenome]